MIFETEYDLKFFFVKIDCLSCEEIELLFSKNKISNSRDLKESYCARKAFIY